MSFKLLNGIELMKIGNEGRGGLSVLDHGEVFMPSSLAGLSMWVAGRFITGLNDGDTIATPVERSGTNNITTQANSNYQAHYKTNVVNGLPVLRFDRAINLYAFPNPIVGPCTIIAVAHQTVASGKYILTTGNGGIGIRVLSNGRWDVLLNIYATSTQKIDSQFRFMAVVVRSANDVDLITDSTLVHITSGTSYATAPPSIGSYGGSIDYWGGDIAELIAYNRALNTSEIAQVRTYLTALYALPFG